MSIRSDDETVRLTTILQQSAQALLEHIQANTVIIPLDDHNPAYIVVGDSGALMRLCRVMLPGPVMSQAH